MINGYSILNGAKKFLWINESQFFDALSLMLYIFLKPIANDMLMAWKSEAMWDESIKPHTAINNSLVPELDYFIILIILNFKKNSMRFV